LTVPSLLLSFLQLYEDGKAFSNWGANFYTEGGAGQTPGQAYVGEKVLEQSSSPTLPLLAYLLNLSILILKHLVSGKHGGGGSMLSGKYNGAPDTSEIAMYNSTFAGH